MTLGVRQNSEICGLLVVAQTLAEITNNPFLRVFPQHAIMGQKHVSEEIHALGIFSYDDFVRMQRHFEFGIQKCTNL